MPWRVSVKFLHLLLKIHTPWVFSLWIRSLDGLNRLFLSIDISCDFLTLKSISRVIISKAHVLIELMLQLFKFISRLLKLLLFYRWWLAPQIIFLLLPELLFMRFVIFHHDSIHLLIILIKCIGVDLDWLLLFFFQPTQDWTRTALSG